MSSDTEPYMGVSHIANFFRPCDSNCCLHLTFRRSRCAPRAMRKTRCRPMLPHRRVVLRSALAACHAQGGSAVARTPSATRFVCDDALRGCRRVVAEDSARAARTSTPSPSARSRGHRHTIAVLARASSRAGHAKVGATVRTASPGRRVVAVTTTACTSRASLRSLAHRVVMAPLSVTIPPSPTPSSSPSWPRAPSRSCAWSLRAVSRAARDGGIPAPRAASSGAARRVASRWPPCSAAAWRGATSLTAVVENLGPRWPRAGPATGGRPRSPGGFPPPFRRPFS